MDFYQALSAPLQQVEGGLKEILSTGETLLSDINSHLLSAKGKRIRPALFFLSLGLFSEEYDKHLPVAVAIELVHTATLVHDDVVDHASQRRGQSTVNAMWGNHTSVLAGDYLFAKAFRLLTEYGNIEVIREMATLVEVITEGEIQQQSERYVINSGLEAYLSRIAKKTARFFAACSRCGGLVCGNKNSTIRTLENFGFHLGMAFQMIDDILDFSADTLSTGKPAGSDLAQGIVTLPVLHLLQVSPHGSRFAEEISTRRINETLITEITGEIVRCGSDNYARELAQKYITIALGALQTLPSNAARETLELVAHFVIERRN